MRSSPVEAHRALGDSHDRQLVVDLIELTLNHGLFVVRAAHDLGEAETIIDESRPHNERWSTWITTTARRCSTSLGRRTP